MAQSATNKSLHPVDVYVGLRVRSRREELGISREKLAKHLSISYQQIQKYESAKNRISQSKLWEIAQVLNVPVSYFYPTEKVLHSIPEIDKREGEIRLLIDAYYSLPDKEDRQAVLHLMKVIAT